MPLKRKILFHDVLSRFYIKLDVPEQAENLPGTNFLPYVERTLTYLSLAPHAEPHAVGFPSGLSLAPHAEPHAVGFPSGLSLAPHAEPHAVGFPSGLSPAPHAEPHAEAAAAFMFFCHPNKFERAIVFSSVSIFKDCFPLLFIIISIFFIAASTHFFITWLLFRNFNVKYVF